MQSHRASLAILASLAGCGTDSGSPPSAMGSGGVLGASGGLPGSVGAGGEFPNTGGSGDIGSGGVLAGTGGGDATGGTVGSGGIDAVGSGGSLATGGADSGGEEAGGTGGTAMTCDLPSSFSWTSSPPLIGPKPPAGRNFVSIKDPTIVFFEDKYHVFATVFETTPGSSGWKSVYLNFTDFAQADAAPQNFMQTWPTGNTVAPQVFYFRPHNKWYLIYQWGARYSTNDDIDNPSGWSAPQQLLSGEPSGSLDFWVICDDVNCHLFFSRDDGVLYRSKTSIANFPAFDGYEIVMQEPSAGLLFEASNVYKVDGTNKYLLLVEAYGPRYFRSWTSESLDGPWTALADSQQDPFAGEANVVFDGTEWTRDISHGELIRSGYDERLTINACNLQLLYQGHDPNPGTSDYGLLPYRLGVLTAN